MESWIELRIITDTEIASLQRILDLILKLGGKCDLNRVAAALSPRDWNPKDPLVEKRLDLLADIGFLTKKMEGGGSSNWQYYYTLTDLGRSHHPLAWHKQQATLKHAEFLETQARESQKHLSFVEMAEAIKEIGGVKLRQESSETKQEKINAKNRWFQYGAGIVGILLVAAQVIVAIIALPSNQLDPKTQRELDQLRYEVDSLKHSSKTLPFVTADSSYSKDTIFPKTQKVDSEKGILN